MADAWRRTFGPVVLVGLVAGTALAVAGTQPWAAVTDDSYSCGAPCAGLSGTSSVGVASLVNALALVALACWGVLLVSRGRFRRVVAGLGALTALGGVAASVAAFVTLPDDVRETYDQIAATAPEVGRTGWSWVGAVAALVGLLAWLAAVRFVRDWPEMGRRYDTPSDSPPEDLWKALDQGHDPTS